LTVKGAVAAALLSAVSSTTNAAPPSVIERCATA